LSGARFLDLSEIRLEVGERPEDLFQRLTAFFEDNLLTADGDITHHGTVPETSEDMTPTLENTVVLLWLQLINPALPQLVKQKYGTILRCKSLASLKPEISQGLTSMLDELRAIDDTKVLRAAATGRPFRNNNQSGNKKKTFKSCVLCKAEDRAGYSSHFLRECRFLPEYDKRALAKSRYLQDDDPSNEEGAHSDDHMQNSESIENALLDTQDHTARRVNIIQSPYLNVYYRQCPVRLTIDTGATTNMVRASLASHIGLPVTKASQMARQADGITPLDVVGETHCQLTRGAKTFRLNALVVEQLDVDILAGNPFLVANDVATRPAKKQIIIDSSEVVYYGPQATNQHSIRRIQAYLVRSPGPKTVVLPGEYIEVKTPQEADPDSLWALEPRLDAPSTQSRKLSNVWPPPQVIQSVGHAVRLTNSTEIPVLLNKNEHFCQICPVTEPSLREDHEPTCLKATCSSTAKPFSSVVNVDPDKCLPADIRKKFCDINLRYDDTFNPTIAKYNGYSGKMEGVVNMGPVLPPQRKGRVPQYNKNRLVELQQKFDELEKAGVFAKPEQVNITVEYLNPSFLISKPNGGTRLVTAFGEVGQYTKPQPSLMPNVDNTLRAIACWKYIIMSDLLKSFYQIPLSNSSMKFCGVATPFKGIRVYTRCAMGMPGSETALEELMCRVLGDLLQEGAVAKIADDLYCGGNTPLEALANWSRVLHALHQNNIRLSASKTIICPRSANILGWVWSQGTLHASSHRIASLSHVEPPHTVQALRSFIGAYKVLSRVLKGYADLLHPLDLVVAGKQSRDPIQWDDQLTKAFKLAQQALSDNKAIHLPRPDDTIWIVTDGSVKNTGIGATLYILRANKLLLAGFFNAKLRKHQVTWMPCEVEALCISSATKHFAPYIIQSKHPVQILTDSRPCVQAYHKLCRGEFSASSRVTAFLSTISRYQARIGHISGAANLP
jgi:hypothetical protein